MRALFFALLLLISVGAYASQPARICRNLDEMHRHLLAERHLAYAGTGIAFNAFVVQFFVNRLGDFVFLGVTNDLTACELVTGSEWVWPVVRDI